MSEFKIIHRPFLLKERLQENAITDSLLWKTCLREIYFFDVQVQTHIQLLENDEVYIGTDAEVFLAQVLCGLKSPLIGETEVFGQFKIWWKSLSPDLLFKKKFQSRMETLFGLVKTVREKALCGHGSQSYGSLLRKNLVPKEAVDILGAGHLALEIQPWIKNKSDCRVWCRHPEKVKQEGLLSGEILSVQLKNELSTVVVIAAPLKHDELNLWLKERGFSSKHKLFDFRSDSASFHPFVRPKVHLKLKDFSSDFDINQNEIREKAQAASRIIEQWKHVQNAKAQVRPYGWDDL